MSFDEIDKCRAHTRECIEVMTAYAEGKSIEVRSRIVMYGVEPNWVPTGAPGWNFTLYEYRTRPKEKPSIDWNAVHPRYTYLAIDRYAQGLLFTTRPTIQNSGWQTPAGAHGESARAFASFYSGDVDWHDSLVTR